MYCIKLSMHVFCPLLSIYVHRGHLYVCVQLELLLYIQMLRRYHIVFTGQYVVVRVLKADSTTMRGIAIAKSSITEFSRLKF